MYFFRTLVSSPSEVLKFTNRSIACWIVLCSTANVLRSLGALNCSSTFRFAVSASAHVRALADWRYCSPSWLQRRCLPHRQRLLNSSPLYAQSCECLTKIVITGVPMPSCPQALQPETVG